MGDYLNQYKTQEHRAFLKSQRDIRNVIQYKSVCFFIKDDAIIVATELQSFIFRPKMRTSDSFNQIARKIRTRKIITMAAMINESRDHLHMNIVKKAWYL